jgi:hypothetical protein
MREDEVGEFVEGAPDAAGGPLMHLDWLSPQLVKGTVRSTAKQRIMSS